MSSTHPHVAVVERYLECLRNERFEEAASQFTENARYYHPPTFRDEVEAVGRENILEYFLESRGLARSTTRSSGRSSRATPVRSTGT